jgi:hypothetical protein
VKIGISASAATTPPTANQARPLLAGLPFELLATGNRLSFRIPRGQL